MLLSRMGSKILSIHVRTRVSFLQVDDLKAKLAAQEAELKQKNDDADKLIHVVGMETEKVSREKAVADEEEQKVALITQEVEQKQKDCEEDLAKAEPALEAAQAALNTLNKVGQGLAWKASTSLPSAVGAVTAILWPKFWGTALVRAEVPGPAVLKPAHPCIARTACTYLTRLSAGCEQAWCCCL